MGHNIHLDQFLMFYSQSEAGNGLTRGLDAELAKQTYAPTKLDRELLTKVLEGSYRLVILTGNAGDGKTAFIQKIELAAAEHGAKIEHDDSLGTRFSLDGVRFRTLYDGSVEAGGKSNLAMLEDFFADFAGDAEPTSSTCAVAAMNEGKLLDFLSHSTRFPWLSRTLLGHLQEGAALPPELVVVNLNLRSVVDASRDQTDCLFDQILDRYVAEEFWLPCDTCPARHRCPVKFNVDTFRYRSTDGLDTKDVDGVIARNHNARVARSRLKSVFQMLHFRKRVHVTVRDLRSALAFVLFGKSTCAQIEDELASGLTDFSPRYYYNALFASDEKDRILTLLQEFDVGNATSPMIDSELSFLPPETPEFRDRFIDFQHHRSPAQGRSPVDLDDFAQMFRSRPRSPEERTPTAIHQAQWYVASLRRKLFFEGNFPFPDNGSQKRFVDDLVPYDNITEFMRFVDTGTDHSGHLKQQIILGISKSENIHDDTRGRENICIRTRHDLETRVRAFFTYPSTQFVLRRDELSSQAKFVEFLPASLHLIHQQRGVRLEISLDLYEMLMRIRDGYVPSAGEMRTFFLNLLMFKKQLMSTPSARMLLTDNDYSLYELTRTPENGIAVGVLS